MGVTGGRAGSVGVKCGWAATGGVTTGGAATGGVASVAGCRAAERGGQRGVRECKSTK